MGPAEHDEGGSLDTLVSADLAIMLRLLRAAEFMYGAAEVIGDVPYRPRSVSSLLIRLSAMSTVCAG